MVDYLQLMRTSGGRGTTRDQQIGELTRGLKALAKELQCVVIAGSQLNRDCEKRTDKRPLLADLRESGSIEADASVIIALYRDEYYHPDTRDKGVAEAIVLKNRNGATETVKLGFGGRYTRFSDLETGGSW